MSKHFFERLEIGYAGYKKNPRGYCSLGFCKNLRTRAKGVGQNLCQAHQSLLREYGGPARFDRPYSFNRQKTCDCCGFNPWQHPAVTKIADVLIRDRVAWGMLIVDHILPQQQGGSDSPENCQTLCQHCNIVKTTLAGDSMPKSLYKDEAEWHSTISRLRPHYERIFGVTHDHP